jgi:hypothetical protein
VRFSGEVAASEGAEAIAGDKPCGRIGSSTAGGKAIALIRLDRAAEARERGEALTADGLSFELTADDGLSV